MCIKASCISVLSILFLSIPIYGMDIEDSRGKIGSKVSSDTNKFFSMALYMRDGDYSRPAGNFANPDLNFDGLKTAFEMLDRAYEKVAGKGAKFPSVIGLDVPPTKPEFTEFIKERLATGSELAVTSAHQKEAIAKAFGLSPKTIVTQMALWISSIPETTAIDVDANLKVRFQAVLEGDSLIGETIDNGHNWEGRPFLPYYVQIRPDQPRLSSKSNREMRKNNAPLDLFWLTRSPWSVYDRYCFTHSFHLGDVFIGIPKRCPVDDIWFWRNEILQWEKNIENKTIPYAHISVCNEMCTTTSMYTDTSFGMPKDHYYRLEMLAEYLLKRGWKPITGKDFHKWYSNRWPCPETPSQLLVFNDTDRNPNGKYYVATFDKVETYDKGDILIAETKFFRISDHQHRLSPFMEVAYNLEAPNLYAAGYAGHDPRKKDERTGNHFGKTFADGTGWVGDPDALSVTATTGNALFWGVDPDRGILTKWEKLAPNLGVPPKAARNRCYSLLIDGKDIQFPDDISEKYGVFFDTKRQGNIVSWKKRIQIELDGKKVPLVISHTLVDKKHQIEFIDETQSLDKHTIELVFRPFWYPAWLIDQERMVYARATGMLGESFAYSVDNSEDIEFTHKLPSNIKGQYLSLYHCDPLRPELAREIRIEFSSDMADEIRFIDKAGSWIWTEARVKIKSLGKFTLNYNRMFSLD